MFKLENQTQNYVWGSKPLSTSCSELKSLLAKRKLEIWMGAHLGGYSRNEESGSIFSDIIEKNNIAVLGSYTYHRFGTLPYLFKVLVAY